MSYLIIDKDYKIYQANFISCYLRSQCRKGNCSIVNVKTMEGMNNSTYQKSLGEYSKIQDWNSNFKVGEVV